MVKGTVGKRGDEHREEVKEGQVGYGSGCQTRLPAAVSGCVGGLGEQRMSDCLPMLVRSVGITGRPQERRREKEKHDRDRADKNYDWEDQQLFVAADDREGTLKQQPTALKLIHLPAPFPGLRFSSHPRHSTPNPF